MPKTEPTLFQRELAVTTICVTEDAHIHVLDLEPLDEDVLQALLVAGSVYGISTEEIQAALDQTEVMLKTTMRVQEDLLRWADQSIATDTPLKVRAHLDLEAKPTPLVMYVERMP